MTDTQQCPAPACSRPEGHGGAHGHELGPGLVLAPWNDGPRPRRGAADDPPIPCNACGAPLMLDPDHTWASCSSCQQFVSISGDHYSQTILPSLYPEVMTDPKMLREFADHRVKDWLFWDTLRLRFGLIDGAEMEKRCAAGEEARERFIAETVLPLERKPRSGLLRRLVRRFIPGGIRR